MSHDTRLSVYLRLPVPAATERRQTSVLGRAESLRRQGLVDELTVTHWQRHSTSLKPLDSTEIEAMEQWAADRGCSLAPAFDRRNPDDDSVVTLPVVSLAHWDGDELVGVYPHRGPCGHCTVADGLDRIEAALRSGEPLQTGFQR